MEASRNITILGTGAFATGLVRSLAGHPGPALTVHVIGRSLARSTRLAELGNAHATLADTAISFAALAADLSETGDLRPLLTRLRPGVLVICASDQSPSETRNGSSAWTHLLRQAGFGVTLPLQAALALRASRACAEVCPATAVVNACFPDAVNTLLRAADAPAQCGLGNVATLATAIRAQLGVRDESRLKLLAHHAHLHAPADPSEDAAAWLDDRPLGRLPQLLAHVRGHPREDLNEIGAAAGASVLRALTDEDHSYVGHVPGPHGLPGGYPVVITGRSIALRLPPGMSERQAIAWNASRAPLDGITVDPHGKAEFTPSAAQALHQHWPDAPIAFGPQDLADLAARQLRLRDDLRRLPTPSPAEESAHA